MNTVKKFRIALLVAAFVLTAAAGAIAPMLPMGADVTEFLPTDLPDGSFWLEMSERFGALDVLMVGLEEPGEPFHPDSLARLDRITRTLSERKAEGILLARTATNLESIRQGEDGEVESDLLIPALPQNEDERAALMERVRSDTQAIGSFVSRDLRAYVIIITLSPDKDAVELAAMVRSVVEAEKGDMGAVYFGAPFIENMMTSQVHRQVPQVFLLFVVFLLLPILLMMRRLIPAFLAIAGAGIALVWWLGLMKITGVTMTATTSGAALVLLALGSLLNARITQLWLVGPGRPLEGRPVLRVLGVAVAGAVGMATLMVFPVPFLSRFGLAMALGLLAMVLAAPLLLLPVLTFLKQLPPPAAGPTHQAIRPVTAAVVGLVLLCGSLYSASQARFFMNPRDLFSSEDEVGKAISFFDRNLGGNDLLQIQVKGNFRDPADLSRLLRLSDLLEGEPLFSDVRSVAQIVAMLAGQFGGVHRIPMSADALANLWFFLEGNPDIAPLVSDDRDEAMIAARINADSRDQNPQRWVAAAQEAVDASKGRDPESARARLAALAYRYRLAVRDSTLTEVTTKAGRQQLNPEDQKEVMQRVWRFLESDESPFTPTPEEWERLKSMLSGGSPQAALSTTIRDMDGYKEMEYPPEVADLLATTLESHIQTTGQELRCDKLMEPLIREVGNEDDVQPFLTRARGILIDLLDPDVQGEDHLEVQVSGFPAVVANTSDRVLHCVWLAALLLWAVGLLGLGLVTQRGWVTLRAGLESLLATALVFGTGYWLRVGIDSASAVIYLLVPLAALLVSPELTSRASEPEPLPGNRVAPTIAIALAAASLSLMITGILPVHRISAVMSLGLTLVAATAMISRRVRSE